MISSINSSFDRFGLFPRFAAATKMSQRLGVFRPAPPKQPQKSASFWPWQAAHTGVPEMSGEGFHPAAAAATDQPKVAGPRLPKIETQGPVPGRVVDFMQRVCADPPAVRQEDLLRPLHQWPMPMLGLTLFHPALRIIGEVPEIPESTAAGEAPQRRHRDAKGERYGQEPKDEAEPSPLSRPLRMVLPHTTRMQILPESTLVYLPWLEDPPFPSHPPMSKHEWPLITRSMLAQLLQLAERTAAGKDPGRFAWMTGPSHFSNSAGLNVLAMLLLLRPEVRQLYCLSQHSPGGGFYGFLKTDHRVVRLVGSKLDPAELMRQFPGLGEPDSLLLLDAYPMDQVERAREISQVLPRCRIVAPMLAASDSLEQPVEMTPTRIFQHMHVLLWSMLMPWLLAIGCSSLLLVGVWSWLRSGR